MRSTRQQWGSVLLGLGLFGSLFLVGAFFLYHGSIAPRRAIAAAEHWVETPCEILAARVVSEELQLGDSSQPDHVFRIEVRFQYDFRGEERVSDRYDFTDLNDGYEAWKREAVAALPPGTRTVCFVNPDNPAEAVLRRGFGPPREDRRATYFLWFATLGMMAVGALGISYFLVAPLGHAFDRLLQVMDPQYVVAGSGTAQLPRETPADITGQQVSAIASDRVRELLRVHGEVRSQAVSDWKGDIPLPQEIATFYHEVGPVNIAIAGYGSPTIIPSLGQLWDLQAGFRGTATNTGLADRLARMLRRRWNSDWIVVATDGAMVLIYSIRDANILQASCRDRTWEPYEVYTDLNTMAACLAILGAVAVEAGEHLTDDDSRIRPQYLSAAVARLVEVLGQEFEAGAVLGAAGWGESP